VRVMLLVHILAGGLGLVAGAAGAYPTEKSGTLSPLARMYLHEEARLIPGWNRLSRSPFCRRSGGSRMTEWIAEASPRFKPRIAGFFWLLPFVTGVYALLLIRGRLVTDLIAGPVLYGCDVGFHQRWAT